MTDRTLDPQALELQATGAHVAQPVAEIVFHSDLGRIGDQTGPLSGVTVIGRDAPRFGASALDDPCVSREQLSVAWLPRAWAFAVEAPAGARRAVHTYGPDLAPCAPGRLPPGGFVAVGDRLLLRLDLQRPEPDDLGLLGTSPAMVALRARIRRVATLDRPALVHGETGAGKELVARALHHGSPRAAGPFQVLNCATVPAELFESELFGHRRGAFTGAHDDRDGLFQAAHGGTLFLDELAELPLPLQAKLLRVVQDGRVKRVGDVRERAVDVRLVAATHQDLEAAVAAGRFREDLYFRLRALRVEVPSLRERAADVPRLFAHLLHRQGAEAAAHLWRPASALPPPIPLAFFGRLLAFPWPGNVREVANVAAETVAWNLDSPAFVEPAWAGAAGPDLFAQEAPAAAPPAEGPPSPEALLAVLAEHDYKQIPTARALGVSRSTLHRWMEALALPRPRDLTAEAIEAVRQPTDSLEALAARLRVSPRGLLLRLGALGLPAPDAEPDG